MYSVFLDELSGRTFVGDMDVVKNKVAILNKKAEKTGRLSEKEYFKTFDLRGFPASVVYISDKGIPPTLKLRVDMMRGVPIVNIYLDSYNCFIEHGKEE